MCSFGSCQTRFEFLSQFRKVRNAFECFVTQVQTRFPKTKCVWPVKINVICTVSLPNKLKLCLTESSIIQFCVISIEGHISLLDTNMRFWQISLNNMCKKMYRFEIIPVL